MRILAVDDDQIILELLAEVLRAVGFPNFHVCSSGAEALDVIESAQVPFDCALLDIQMPGMDGIELLSKVRAIPQYRSTPVLMITAMSDRQYIERAFACGATDYITKPFEIGEVNARLSVFEKQLWERNQLEDRNPVSNSRHPSSIVTQEELRECLNLREIDGFIDYLALENYLLQMSRLSLFGMSAFGIVVPDLKHLFAASSVHEFRFAVTDISEAIFESLKAEHFFAAHAGGGSFVCVLTRGSHFDPNNFEALLRQTVHDMDLHFCDGRPMRLYPVVGEPVALHLRSARSAANALSVALSQARHAVLAPRDRKAESRGHLKQLFGL